MQKWLIENKLLMVDKFLEHNSFVSLQKELRTNDFSDVDISSEFNIWRRNAPLNPRVGQTVFWPAVEKYRKILEQIEGLRVYPTGTLLDTVLSTVREIAISSGIINITNNNHYAGIVASVFLFPPGSRLVWHTDEAYLGAFSLYCSERWTKDSGGYFAYQNGETSEMGINSIVEPRPNRAVIFGSNVKHSVLAIPSDAEDGRVAISGFFVSRDRAERLFEMYLKDLAMVQH